MRWMAFLLMVAFAFGGYSLYLQEQSRPANDSLPHAAMPVDPCQGETKPAVYVRSLSCSMAACHGAIEPTGTETGLLRNEYRIWFDSDPHANAARVLGNAVSQRMVESLVEKPPLPKGYAKVYERCLACHNTTGARAPEKLIDDPAYFDQDDRYEGVGCEMCHGKASEWKDIHYFDCWKELSVEEKRKRGLSDTKTLSARAALCARCHVGEEGRDADHDLIAAGHPQMKFEMLGYHALMPHHWNDQKDQFAGFEAELWAAGQIASAKASLELLESRAEQAAGKKRPWPEFSESDCFACHHDLQDSTWRRDRGFVQTHQKVLVPWGVWHFALLPELANGAEDQGAREFFEAFQALKASMQGEFFPDPLAAKTQAARARRALMAWSQKEPSSSLANRLPAFLHQRGISERPLQNWDEAVQLYLAVYALKESQSRAANEPDESWKEKAKKLREGLGFAEGYQSPRHFPMVIRTKDDVRKLLNEMLRDLPEQVP